MTHDYPDADLANVDAHRRSTVALDVIHAAHVAHEREHRRRPALTAREALVALQFEALLVWVAAGNVRHGVLLGDEDFGRLTAACERIGFICDEVIG